MTQYETVSLSNFIRKKYPEIYHNAVKALKTLDVLPTPDQLRQIRVISRQYRKVKKSIKEYKHGGELNMLFVCATTVLFDSLSVLFDVRMKNGLRVMLAQEIGCKSANISKIFHVTKCRYKYISDFKRRVNAIIEEYHSFTNNKHSEGIKL